MPAYGAAAYRCIEYLSPCFSAGSKLLLNGCFQYPWYQPGSTRYKRLHHFPVFMCTGKCLHFVFGDCMTSQYMALAVLIGDSAAVGLGQTSGGR